MLNSEASLMSDERTEEFSSPPESRAISGDAARDGERGSPARKISITKTGMRTGLPALDDDADVGVQKEHIVTRDGKADLLFTGVRCLIPLRPRCPRS